MAKGLIHYWWFPVVSTILALAGASVYLRVAKYYYAAEIKVTPPQAESSVLPGNLGTLAAAAGVSLARGQGSGFPLYLELLRSRAVAERLITNDGMMRSVFPDDWPAPDGRLPPPGPLHGLSAFVKSVLGVPQQPRTAPDAAELEKYLRDTISVSENPRRGVTTIRFLHEDNIFAGQFLNAVHRAADDIVRERTVARSTASVAYIQEKLQGDLMAEHRIALAQILGEQERALMMARSGLPFSADILGGVAVSGRPVRPRPVLVLGFALAVGLLSGFGVALLRIFNDTVAQPGQAIGMKAEVAG
ncbi:hypothetical protein [Thermaurantiacus sp.]